MAGDNPYKGRTEPYQCTYVCWDLVKSDTGYELPWFSGNAVDWYQGAKNAGLEVSQTARAKSVIVYKDTVGGGAGHVAYIKEINSNGVLIQEGNYGANHAYRERTVPSVPTTITWNNGARQQQLIGYIYIPVESKTIAAPGSQTILDGTYFVISQMDNALNMTVDSISTKAGANVRLWHDSLNPAQTWKVKWTGDGYYKLINTNSGKALDVAGGSFALGTNVQQYDEHDGDPERWVIRANADGSYSLIAKNGGYTLDSVDGKTADGTNLRVWENNNSAAQSFYFVQYSPQTIADGRYYIAPKIDDSVVLSVKDQSKSNAANVELYNKANRKGHTWDVKHLGNGVYSIINTNSGMSLDVADANRGNAINVQQMPYVNNDAQHWYIKDNGDGSYGIISRCGGRKLDMSGGKTASGTNVQMYNRNDADAQKWIFKKPPVDVKLDPNGGYWRSDNSTTVKTISAEVNKSTSLSSAGTLASNEHKVFAGWSEKKNDTSGNYKTSITTDKAVTLYAQWNNVDADKAIIILDGNGGYYSTSSSSLIIGGKSVVTLTEYKKGEVLPASATSEGGYFHADSWKGLLKKFNGWYKDKDLTQPFNPKGDVISGDITLYAKWERDTNPFGPTPTDPDEPTPTDPDEPTPTNPDEPTPIDPDSQTPYQKDDQTPSQKDDQTPSQKDDQTPAPVTKQNGLANAADKDGVWWYYKDGKIDTTHSGVDQNKYGWWRVENGKVNFGAQGIYQNGFGWWKTTNGKVTFQDQGIYQNQFGWWKCKDSKVDFTAQSVYQNQHGWWKVTDGKVTFKENGLFKNQYGTWKVENSKVNFNFNGTFQGKVIKNGKVQ